MLLNTEGRINEIKPTGEYFGTLIMKKRVRGMIQPVVFDLRGHYFKACTNGGQFKEGDKVKIWFVPVCRKHNERYYTNLSIEKIELIERPLNNLFNQPEEYVDEETGEIIE
jgi:hypothetical protein